MLKTLRCMYDKNLTNLLIKGACLAIIGFVSAGFITVYNKSLVLLYVSGKGIM